MSMTKSSEGTTGDIAADLAALRQELARLSESVSAMLQAQAQGGAQHVADTVSAAKAGLAATTADVKSRISSAGGEIEASIARNPMTAALITFAVGMVLGMMSRPRH